MNAALVAMLTAIGKVRSSAPALRTLRAWPDRGMLACRSGGA